jgi:hypothetical protein
MGGPVSLHLDRPQHEKDELANIYHLKGVRLFSVSRSALEWRLIGWIGKQGFQTESFLCLGRLQTSPVFDPCMAVEVPQQCAAGSSYGSGIQLAMEKRG